MQNSLSEGVSIVNVHVIQQEIDDFLVFGERHVFKRNIARHVQHGVACIVSFFNVRT
jgi:hypothetical protein